MNISQVLIAELTHEAVSMRKSIERVPADKFDWKPHEKSMSLKALTVHCAEIYGLIDIVLNTDELDFATAPAKPDFKTTEEIVAFFDKGLEATLKSNGIYELFDSITVTDEVKKGKDNPDIYLLAAEKLNVDPADCMVYEDIIAAVGGAKLAGMNVTAVYDKASEKDLNILKEKADKYIYSYKELL